MGKGPVTRPAKEGPPSWKLRAPHDARTQGIVVSGFSDLPWAEALFLKTDQPGAGWIKALRGAVSITNAVKQEGQKQAAALAFTWSGLKELGLGKKVLDTFSTPFQEGMHQEDRLRRLGDKNAKGEWQATVINGGPIWSGDTATAETVHALLLLYHSSQEEARLWAEDAKEILAPFGVAIVRRLSLGLHFENGIAREHFGFADGLSQPIPYGDSVVPPESHAWHGVPLGEILFGHTNAHHEMAPGPYVEEDGKDDAGLTSEGGAPNGFLNLGLDGSYMVVRELRQNVAAFWNSLKANAERIQAHDPRATHVTADWLAERVIGRTMDGHLLRPGGNLPPDPGEGPHNDAGFIREDPHGFGCPVGSHVRRSNPRDGLAPDLATAQTVLDAANSHRILRRGRKYGATPRSRYEADNEERGLLFVCLNSDIARQFEFVQQTWMLNQNFATLFDETDPLVGPKGPFTIREQSQPLRRIIEVETFIQSAGGEYFFLPSIPALDYLAKLSP